MSENQYYYCLDDHTVERADQACKAADRLGPYPTKEDAANALEQVRVRNEQWENDPRYHDGDDREVDVDEDGYNILDETR